MKNLRFAEHVEANDGTEMLRIRNLEIDVDFDESPSVIVMGVGRSRIVGSWFKDFS
jgi:hypothetical protein